MARRVNVRVEARELHPNASYEEKSRNDKGLLLAFRQACNKAGIQKEIKRREFYETKSQIRRKKMRERQANLLKIKMNESFIEKPKSVKKKPNNTQGNNYNRRG